MDGSLLVVILGRPLINISIKFSIIQVTIKMYYLAKNIIISVHADHISLQENST